MIIWVLTTTTLFSSSLALVTPIVTATERCAAMVSLKMSSATVPSSATSSSSSASPEFYTVQQVPGGEDDPRVVDIATFRNEMINPQAVVERAQEKRDNLDTTKVAIDGLKVGVFQVGPAVALASYFSAPETMTQDAAMMEAATNYGLFGVGLGVILAINGYIGKSVYVPDVAEATNRIVVDYSEGILRQQDFGFVAVLNENTDNDDEDMKKLRRIYRSTNGVIATVDAQWRNSPNCPKGTKKISNLPSHLHIKNMEVHYKQRSKGIGKALLKMIEDHAKQNTDAEMLTLEVAGANQPAVQLYRSVGFEPRENPNWRSKNVFMVKELK
ncbi:acyl-CoA N-acyltransferase [Nitzschia inconspicua]|uniref:Acyl-CoA N-acyltransferase n=1 Tax=Nitzschia inconspicua TaxID=303405 RepID=A0A9K3LGC0_9STRA|nr:acyl-CoA N-acyltransferase [Nitzschia inconspicua]